MKSRLVQLVVGAATSGFVDFKSVEPTPQWWTGLHLRLAAYEQVLEGRVQRANFEYGLAQLSNSALDPSQAGDMTRKALAAYMGSVMPWLTSGELQDKAMAIEALWYINHAPDKLGLAKAGPDSPTTKGV